MNKNYPQPGNWQKFDSFSWWGRDDEQIPDPKNWTIYYTHNRDSRLLEQSNASVIAAELDKFPDDAIPENHSHWAVGWVEGFAIRCLRPTGEPTEVYGKICNLIDRMNNYSVLNEADYSQREDDATWENLLQILADVTRQSDWKGTYPIDTPSKVYTYLADYTNELENTDDQGGYPDEDVVAEQVEQTIAEWLSADYVDKNQLNLALTG